MDRRLRRVLSLQLVLLVGTGAAAYAIFGQSETQAVVFGGLVALSNSGLIAWRMRPQAIGQGVAAELAAHQQLKKLYRYALERYLGVGALLAVGLGALHFMPLGLLAGFILGQVAWVIAPLTIEET